MLITPFVLDGLLPENGGDGTAGTVLLEESSGSQFGKAVVGGDFNGDGVGDVAVGAPRVNKIYVFFGAKGQVTATLDASAATGATGFLIENTGSATLSSGDINGDNIDDIVADKRVIFGRASSLAEAIDANSLDGQNGFAVSGANVQSVTSIGDFNGDGVDDLFVDRFTGFSLPIVFGNAGPWAGEFSISEIDGTNGITLEGGSNFIGIGDVNGDGMSDLVNIIRSSEARLVYGRTSPPATLDVGQATGTTVLTIDTRGTVGGLHRIERLAPIGDINGDAVDDLAFSDVNRAQVFVVFGKSGGLGAEIKSSEISGAKGFVLDGGDVDRFGEVIEAAGDLNNDGLGDFVIASNQTDVARAYVLFGTNVESSVPIDGRVFDGVRGFVVEEPDTQLLTGKTIAAIGDFNDDGFDDLALGGEEQFSLGSEANKGRTYIAFGKDFVAALPRVSTSDAEVIERTDRFRFELNAPWYYPVTAIDPDNANNDSEVETAEIVELADLNNDGLQDIAVLGNVLVPGGFNGISVNRVVVMLNNGDDTYARGVSYQSHEDPDAFQIADIDGDSDLDIITVSEDEDTISILLNRGDATFETPFSFAAGTNPFGLRFADVDGDADLDAVVANDDSSAYGISVIKNLGGGFFDSPSLQSLDRKPLAYEMADANQDGSIDIVLLSAKPPGFTNDRRESVSVMLNDGSGAFADHARVDLRDESVERQNPQSLIVADFDNDDDMDVIVGDLGTDGFNSTGYWVVPGTANGDFTTPRHQPLDIPPVSIQAGDFNQDGFVDAIFDSDNNWLTILANHGGLQFDSSRTVVVSPGSATSRLTDWDADGDLDIVRGVAMRHVGASSSAEDEPVRVAVVRNHDGVFTAGRRWPIGPEPTGLEAADFDGDGNTDFAVANADGVSSFVPDETVSIVFGDGDAGFTRVQKVPVGVRPTAFAAGDFDGDGKVDLAVGAPGSGGFFGGNSTSPSIGIFLQSTAGEFATPREFTANGFIDDLVARDIDGDGDIDILAMVEGGGFSGTDGRIMAFINNGSGLFLRRDTDIPDILRGFDFADLNGDEFVDAIVSWSGTFSTNFTTAILFGTGAGTFDEPVIIGSPGFTGVDGPAGVPLKIGDFTGDGELDAAIVTSPGQNGQTITVVPSIAAEMRGEPIVSAVAGEFASLTSADVDNDGDFDLIAAGGHERFGFGFVDAGAAIVFLNDGTGNFDRGLSEVRSVFPGLGGDTIGFEPGIRVPLSSFAAEAIGIDLNGDSLPELISVDSQSGSITVYENASVGITHAAVHVEIGQPFDREVRVDFTTNPDNATTRVDYQTLTGTLTIPVGQTTATAMIEVDNDHVDEPDEELFVDFFNPFNAVIDDSRAVVQIIDNDATLALALSTNQLSASGGNVDVTVTRNDVGNIASALVVNLSSDSVALSSLPQSITIPANEASVVVALQLAATTAGTITLSAEATDFASASAVLDVFGDIGNPWRNPADPLDTNDDGSVSPIDALIIINFLNEFGPQALGTPNGANQPPPFLDPSDDGSISPIDALQVINHLNAPTASEGEFSISPRGFQLVPSTQAGSASFDSLVRRPKESSQQAITSQRSDLDLASSAIEANQLKHLPVDRTIRETSPSKLGSKQTDVALLEFLESLDAFDA